MSSFNGSIDSIEVKTPCSEDWNEMKGNEKVRFCSHCSFEVNDISRMTRKEAMRLVRSSDGRICVRYVKNPVTSKILFAGKLHQITRRAGLAAGVLGASLTLSTLTYAQDVTIDVQENAETRTAALVEKPLEEDKTGGTARLSGTITDPNGAVVPNVTVRLVREGFQRAVTSSDEGFYEFTNIPSGVYSIVFEGSSGFKTANASQDIKADGDVEVNISLEVGAQFVTMGIMSISSYSSPLHVAVSDGDIDAVRSLIAKGVGINGKEESYGNITPLFVAVENGNLEITELLLSYRARANALSTDKQTPLMRLDDDATAELVRALFKYGAKVNLKDVDGNTALILAARSVKTEVLQILLDHGASVNAQNKQGQTALMNAAEADHLENVRALIMAGADVNLKDEDGDTALDLTTDAEIEQLLKSHGAVSGEKP
jgi:ankyrin repeat protein